VQLVENLQRDDLHPLDEAEGYQRLFDTTDMKKETLGEKIGKSRTYVYQRLHLLNLGAGSARGVPRRQARFQQGAAARQRGGSEAAAQGPEGSHEGVALRRQRPGR
jgi:ParB/RepB/Spo0J family partition protein